MASNLQLVYASRRNLPTDPAAEADEVRDILTVSRKENAKLDITGALLSSAHCFAQALEGPVEAVEQLFHRIRVDPRHHHVVLLLTRAASERMFPDWSMGFTTPTEVDEIERAAKVLEQAFLSSAEKGDIEAAGTAICELIQSGTFKVQIW